MERRPEWIDHMTEDTIARPHVDDDYWKSGNSVRFSAF